MDDLEITKLCAEAMGLRWTMPSGTGSTGCQYVWVPLPEDHPSWDGGQMMYDPLHDDAQAMALAKRFMLDVDFFSMSAYRDFEGEERFGSHSDESVNRAICECVAKMQKSK